MYSFPTDTLICFLYGLRGGDNSRREDSQDLHTVWPLDHLMTLGFILKKTRNLERVLKPVEACSVYPFDKDHFDCLNCYWVWRQLSGWNAVLKNNIMTLSQT